MLLPTAEKNTPKRKHQETSPNEKTSPISKKQAASMETDWMGRMEDLIKSLPTKADLSESLKNVATKKEIEDIRKDMAMANQELANLRAENKELKEKVSGLEKELTDNNKNFAWIESQIANKKLVFRGLKKQREPAAAVAAVISDKLSISSGGAIAQAYKIAEFNGKMHVVAEFDSEATTSLILKNKKKLAGTDIYIERDLGPRRQKDKQVLLSLKKIILAKSEIYGIRVEADRMRIDDKWFSFNQQRQFVCGKDKGEVVLKELYGDFVDDLNLDYQHIFAQVSVKNSAKQLPKNL